MIKNILKKGLILPSMFVLSSCVWNTSIKGEMLLEVRFKCMKEYEGETLIEDTNRWFLFESTLYTTKNETYSLTLKYKDTTIEDITFSGSYHLEVVSPGHSASGWFTLNDEKVDLTFKNSYFLIFDLPAKYNPHQEQAVRTLHFQRW